MSNTFMILSKSKRELESVEELHVNLWYLNKKRTLLDIGILFNIKIEDFQRKEILELLLNTPFKIKKDTLLGLYDKIESQNTLQLVFNDEVDSRLYGTSVLSKRSIFIRFNSGRKFVLFEPVLKVIENSQVKIDLHFSQAKRSEIAREFSQEKTVKIYIRFRYEIDIDQTTNILKNPGFLHQKIYYDFRFNELRSFHSSTPDSERLKNTVNIKDVRIFVIMPIHFKIILNQNREMVYIRLLEKENLKWNEYLRKLDEVKEDLLVYYWKDKLSEISLKKSYEILISFEQESSSSSKKANLSLVLAIITTLMYVMSQLELNSILSTVLKYAGPFVLAISLALISSVIYDIGKYSLQKIGILK